MGEGYSQGPEQQLPAQEQLGEQPRQYSDGSNTTIEAEPTSDAIEAQDVPAGRRDEPDTDTRWDHDKAETMAGVLKQDGRFDASIESKDLAEEYVNSNEYVDDNTKRESRELKEAQETASNSSSYEGDYGKKRLAEAQDDYDSAVAETHVMGQKGIERSRQKVDKVVDEVLSPYQELYDMNPATFGEMPTKEFMVVAKELAEISRKIKDNEAYSNKIEWWNRQIKDAFEKKRIVDWNIIDALEQEIGMGLEIDDDAYDEVSKKFEAEVSDSFDKTPRQIMEGYMRVSEEYTSQFAAKMLADEQRKKELLDKYGPEASDQGQN